MTDFEHHFIETNGIKLHVVLAGPADGEPVILLHGFPEYWGGWKRQIPALAEAGYRVIVPDQRGYGQSDVPRGVGAYALFELGKDIVGLLDYFGYENVFLVGHDWGAVVAWGVGILYPGRVRRLAILNVPHPAAMVDFLKKSPRQMLKSWYIGFFQIPGLADWLLARNDFALAVRLLVGSGKKGTFSRPELEEYKKAWKASGGLTGMINWYRALARKRASLPGSPRLVMPVLILWGKQDVALSAEMAEASLTYCENGQLVYFENATHWVQHDEAEAVNARLLEFIRSTSDNN
jgi:pimeloyl-ACP methyl ester carboxylesterase